MKNTSYKKGLLYEFFAILILKLKGFKILDSRYKGIKGSNYGEVDIIAMKKNTIHCIEVKYRKDFKTSAESISDKQKQRSLNSAFYFAAKQGLENCDFQFDALLFYKIVFFKHLKNI